MQSKVSFQSSRSLFDGSYPSCEQWNSILVYITRRLSLIITIPIRGPKSETDPTRKAELTWVRRDGFALETESPFPLTGFLRKQTCLPETEGPKFGLRNKMISQTERTHNHPSNFRPGCRIFNDLRVVYRSQMSGCLLKFWWLISVCLAFTRAVVMKNISICGDQLTRRMRRAILCCNQNRMSE